MALIKCADCGKEISDKAKSCPNCGCPVVVEDSIEKLTIVNAGKKGVVNNTEKNIPVNTKTIKAPPPVMSKEKKFSTSKLILAIVGVVVGVVVVGLLLGFVVIPMGRELINTIFVSTNQENEVTVDYSDESLTETVIYSDYYAQENVTPDTTQVQIIVEPTTIIVEPTTIEKTTESTTSAKDMFDPQLVYSNPFTYDLSRTSGYIVRAEFVDYAIKSVYSDAAIDFQFKLTEKSGEAYMDMWYFHVENISFYDAKGNFLGSGQLVSEVTNLQVGDKFTTTLFNIPLDTAKIVLN